MLEPKDILIARQNMAHLVRRTPLHHSFGLSKRLGRDVWLKPENLQITGAFKVRGAINKIASLSAEERARGVVTPSSGNFALGIAYAAHVLGGVSVNLFMPTSTPSTKTDKLAEYGAKTFLVGDTYDEASDAAKEFHREHELIYTDSVDDVQVIAGQGTVGLEILEDLPDADAILVPIGGGGLVAGVSVAAKTVNPKIKIIGVQSELSPSAYLSLKEGRCYERYDYDPTICEGLAGGFGIVPFGIAKDLIDEVVLISDEEAREAILAVLEADQLVVEGSAAVGVAAMLFDKVALEGKKVVSVITGGNIDMGVLRGIVAERLSRGA